VGNETDKVKVDNILLGEMLGPPHGTSIVSNRTSLVGVVNGLAYTPTGGEVMPIEVSIVNGTGKMTLTGRLGEVMQESAKIAVTYLRSLPKAYDIPSDIHTAYDIHVHALEGAVSKDGPSAGISLTTALVSAVTNTPVKKGIVMTGEITLKGRVLKIGGLKEKMLAAYKEKMKEIIIPRENLVDLYDIPDNVKESMIIHPVTNIEEVFKIAIPSMAKTK
jgi:ATP-dependent Lon protease